MKDFFLNACLWVGLFLLALPFAMGLSGNVNILRSIIMFVIGLILISIYIFKRDKDAGTNT